MDWDDFIWLVIAGAFLLINLLTIVVAACQVIKCVQARQGHDELLEAILQDVAYSNSNSKMDEEECAICVTPYESGEPCSVLPACAHMFHKPCVATWLRNTNTCPLCRATVRPVAAAADDMV